jgi:adenylate cyclase
MERRMAAILAADVVGYSRLMEADEEATLSTLKTYREVIDRRVNNHRGRVFGSAGDSVIAEFASPVEAVRCALEIQTELEARNVDLAEDRRMRFRIGVNLGDVMAEGDSLFGDGVNIAARLEELAEPGHVFISGKVYDEVAGKIDGNFIDCGEREVKNIARPVRVWRWSTTAIAPGASLETPLDKPSIAVLPFVNMSGDVEQEYFADGITEDIITELSRFKELSVVSRNSSFVFKGKATALREVGEKLKVDYIVEGSIRKAGNRVRVTAQLVDAKSDKHIWADRYDRELEDIFEVQDDVVRRVSSTLVGRLEHERQERARRQSKSQLKAYDLYLRGREQFFNWSVEDNSKARDFLMAAIEIEPEYAAALALSSEVLLRMWLNGWSIDPEQDLAESFNAAKRADEIDDQDSRVQTALGLAYIFQRKLEKAKHHFETALKLNPNDTRVLVYYSRQAVFDGHTEKAVELCHRALNLNPYGKYSYNLGIACFVAHQYRQTIELLDGIRNPPATILALLAASYAMAGDEAKAASTYARFSEAATACPVFSSLSQPEDWQEFFSCRWPFRNPEDLEHLMEALGKAGLPVRN